MRKLEFFFFFNPNEQSIIPNTSHLDHENPTQRDFFTHSRLLARMRYRNRSRDIESSLATSQIHHPSVPFDNHSIGVMLPLPHQRPGQSFPPACPQTISRTMLEQFFPCEIIGDTSTNPNCCPICLDTYSVGEKVRQLPCAHMFHASCIDIWFLNSAASCPLCKRDYSDRESKYILNSKPMKIYKSAFS